jgi:hypothetical protein
MTLRFRHGTPIAETHTIRPDFQTPSGVSLVRSVLDGDNPHSQPHPQIENKHPRMCKVLSSAILSPPASLRWTVCARKASPQRRAILERPRSTSFVALRLRTCIGSSCRYDDRTNTDNEPCVIMPSHFMVFSSLIWRHFPEG